MTFSLCRHVLVATLLLMPKLALADAFSDIVEAELNRSGTPGASIVIVRGGNLLRAQGFGEANIEHGVSVHPDTVFKTGAVGLQFTAASIMLLVEDGKIELDAPVGRYLDGTPASWSHVTVRNLLDHTSGLPATPNGDFRADYTNAELLAIIAAQDINFPAGSRFRFSYAGYIVLGMLIDQVTGEHWSQFMAQRLFEPLGMYRARGIDEMAIIAHRASGYEWREGALRNAEWISPTANSTADGSLYMSALDYALWAEAVSDRRLLSQESWDVLTKPVRTSAGVVCSAIPGWYLRNRAGEQYFWQAGNWQGFQTFALRYPDRDLSIAVFANGEKADVYSLAHRIAVQSDPHLARIHAHARVVDNLAVTERARALVSAISSGTVRQTDFG